MDPGDGWTSVLPKPMTKFNLIDTVIYTILDYDALTKKYKVKTEDESGHVISAEGWEDQEYIEGACKLDVLRTINNIEENF